MWSQIIIKINLHCNKGKVSLKLLFTQSYVWLFATPWTVQPTSLPCPWDDFPGKNTGVGCHSLLQVIFPIQGLNPDLLHCRQILYCLSRETLSPPPDWTLKAFIRTCLESRSGTLSEKHRSYTPLVFALTLSSGLLRPGNLFSSCREQERRKPCPILSQIWYMLWRSQLWNTEARKGLFFFFFSFLL